MSIAGADAVAVSYPGFFDELERLSQAGDDRQDLSGGLHGRRQDHRRAALAERLGWRAEDIDELIEARERHDRRRHLRAGTASRISAPPSARSCACCCRCGTRCRHRRRHVHGSREPQPRSTSTALSVWLDVPLATVDRAAAARTAAGRSPPTARRWSGCSLCGRRPTLTRTCASTPARARPKRSPSGSSNSSGAGLSVRYLLLSDIHANIDAFEAVLAARRGRLGPRARARRSRRLRRRAQRWSIDAVRELEPRRVIRGNHDKAACGLDDGSQFNHVARTRGGLDRPVPDARQSGLPARAADGAGPDRRADRDLPRRAVRRGPLHLRRQRRAARHSKPRRGRSASSATRTCRSMFWVEGQVVRRRRARADPRRAAARARRAVPGQRRLGRPAARRRSARAAYGVLDDERARDAAAPGAVSGREGAARILAAGLPASLANRLALGR